MGGWWWGSQPTSDDSPSTTPSAANPVAPTPSSSTPSPPLSRDEQALSDLRTLFTALDPDRAAAASAAAQATTSRRAASAAAGSSDDPDSLYPTTMKCAGCFDQAYYCSSLGGQLTNIYRYGGMRSCSDLWAQWRFCMRTKAMGAEERRERVREWEQRKVAKYKVGRSSEDVWSVREEPVREPFAQDIDRGDEEVVMRGGQC